MVFGKRSRVGGDSGRRRASAASPGGVYEIGSEVEVRSNDEGFHGAWYEAVVSGWFPRYRLHTVVFSTLLSDEDPSMKLVEFVAVSNIRPRPSRSDVALSVHQVVEAYHNDGWWRGAVVAVSRGGEGYVVCFPRTREVIDFPASEVRPMLKWFRRQWIEVTNERKMDMFCTGAKVEVTRDTENHGVSWFPATIMKNIGQSFFLVEYCYLIESGNYNKPLEEIVDLHYIRPCPPPHESFSFDFSDEVEVFQGDHWLVAEIVKLLPLQKYAVQSKYRTGELEVQHSDLRLHQNWIAGKWDYPGRKKHKLSGFLQSNLPRRRHKSKAGKTLNFPIMVSTSMEDEHLNMEEQRSDSETSKKNRTFKDISTVLVDCSRLQEAKSSLLESQGQPVDPLTNTRSPTLTEEGNISDSHFQTIRVGYAKLSSSLSQGEETRERVSFELQETTETPVIAKGNCLSEGENSEHLLMTIPIQSVLCDHASGYFPLSSEPRVRNGPHLEFHKKKLIFCSRRASCNNDDLYSEKRRRGRKSSKPCKRPNIEVNGSLERIGWKETERATNHGECIVKGVGDASIVQSVDLPCVSQQIDFIAQQMSPGDRSIRSSGASGVTSDKLVAHPSEYFAMNGTLSLEAPEGNEEGNHAVSSQSEDHVQFISCTPPSVEALKISQETMTNSARRLSNPQTDLPFVMTSPVWPSICEMGIFEIMPQSPHFSPLEQYSVDFREGMAIGLMVTFSKLAENICKLSISDDMSAFTMCLDTLRNLQGHGFDVGRLQARVQQLLDIKDLDRQTQEKKACLEESIRSANYKSSRFDSLLFALDALISESERNLVSLHERRALLDEQTQEGNLMYLKLKKDAQELEESCLNIGRRFKEISTAPWK